MPSPSQVHSSSSSSSSGQDAKATPSEQEVPVISAEAIVSVEVEGGEQQRPQEISDNHNGQDNQHTSAQEDAYSSSSGMTPEIDPQLVSQQITQDIVSVTLH